MAEVMSMISEDNAPGELNAEEQDSLKVGEEMEAAQEQMLAGKYKNAEELEAAYLELQKKLGEQPEEEASSEEEPEEETDSTLFDRLWEEAQTDKLSDETLKELTESNPADLAKMYLDYRTQVQAGEGEQMTEQDTNSLKEAVGGEQAYADMMGWASQNLSEEEIAMYDSVMESGDKAAAYFAVEALSNRYDDANGVEGNLLQGKAPTNNDDTFKSQAELVEAMGDPRYSRDPAYRQEVMRRLERSDIDF
jgi:hypothetical protein|tara:strand:+ start:3334 stop:4083 length:750 start_codon:yes stop_codon:yes gene_type:complete